MNLVSKILVGALVLIVCAVVWHLLTQKNRGCSGSCAGCSAQCDRRKNE